MIHLEFNQQQMQVMRMASYNPVNAIRLKNDYKLMESIKGNIIDWKLTKGSSSVPEEFKITFNIRSVVSSGPEYREKHEAKLIIPDGYPHTAPEMIMLTKPFVFHPNWYRDGRWCPGNWIMTESLSDFVLRGARTLQFHGLITNPSSSANGDAKDFYLRNKSLFPTDTKNLPSPSLEPKKKFVIVSEAKKKKKFVIKDVSE